MFSKIKDGIMEIFTALQNKDHKGNVSMSVSYGTDSDLRSYETSDEEEIQTLSKILNTYYGPYSTDKDRESALEDFLEIVDKVSVVKNHVESLNLLQSDGTNRIFTMEGSQIFVDGQPLHAELNQHILNLLEERDERGWIAFSKFVDKLYRNVDPYVQDQFFPWLKYQFENSGHLSLDEDGDLIAYKGVSKSGEGIGYSLHSGYALVKDGDQVTEYKHDRIPNKIGTEVFMPRAMVAFDPNEPCSYGLHVSNKSYADGYGNCTLMVKVDVSDIVSVPVDSYNQKVRASKYKILKEVEQEYSRSTYYDEDVIEDDYCEYCGSVDSFCDCEEDC